MKKISELEFFKKRSVRIWSAIAAIVIFLSGFVVLILVLSSQMFSDNPRFTLKHVRVSSHHKGFWNGRR